MRFASYIRKAGSFQSLQSFGSLKPSLRIKMAKYLTAGCSAFCLNKFLTQNSLKVAKMENFDKMDKMDRLEKEENLFLIQNESYCIQDKDGRILGNAVKIAEDYLLIWETNGLIIDSLRKHELKLHSLKDSVDLRLQERSQPYQFFKYLPDENLVILKINLENERADKNKNSEFKDVKIGEKVLVFGKRGNAIPCLSDTRVNNFLVDNINYKIPTTLSTFSVNLGSSNLKSNESFLIFNKNLDKTSLCKTFDGNTGFCISPAQMRSLEYLLLHKKEVQRPYLGLSIKSVGHDQGVFVFKVNDDSPAQKGGLQMGDTLVTLDGFRCRNVAEFFTIIGVSRNRSLNGTVSRDGKLKDVVIEL